MYTNRCLIHERGNLKMGSKKKNKANPVKEAEVIQMPSAPVESTTKSKINWHTVFEGFMGAAILAGLVGGINMYRQLGVIEADISTIKEDITGIKGDVSALKSDVSTLKSDVSALQIAVADLQVAVFGTNTLNLTSAAVKNLAITWDKNDACMVSSPKWGSTDIIATDSDTGEEYTAGQLIDKPLLLSYIEDGQEVYFLGQFNENNHWDGECTINVYKNDQLVLITQAIYDDGEMQSYEQVLPYTNQGEKAVWSISKRQCVGGVNAGESWSYLREKEYTKPFGLNDVTTEDILSVEKFEKYTELQLEGYYYGNTSEGTFNDESGEAYVVKYFADGTVRMLYKGFIKDGKFEDSTDNAWYIVKGEDTDYMYYKGIFKNGKPQNDAESVFKNPVSLDEINEIIDGLKFNCKLNWNTIK